MDQTVSAKERSVDPSADSAHRRRAEEKILAAEAGPPTIAWSLIRNRRIVYMPTVFLQGTLPCLDPGSLAVWQRSINGVSLRVDAATGRGLPYGRYPRLLLSWVASEVVRTGSPELRLGRDVHTFAASFGIDYRISAHAATLTRMRDQMRRLFGAVVSISRASAGSAKPPTAPIWQTGEGFEEEPIGSRLSLSDEFYREIAAHSAPLDLDCVHSLRRSPLGLDLYAWLTWQFSFTHVPRSFSWPMLHAQFGSPDVSDRQFKVLWKNALKRVLITYPAANIEVGTRRVTLRPSLTSVPRARPRLNVGQD
jgi:hypothetical protein